MNVEKVFKSKRKNEIKQLYETAFPKTERMPFPLMLIMSCLWHTEFLAYYDEDVLCGIAYMASLRKQTFIMFTFARYEHQTSQTTITSQLHYQ